MKQEVAKTICILVCGKAGTGKTTLTNFLKKEFESKGYTVEIARFASGVKATSKFMGWDGEKDCKGRKLLQGVGGVGREYDKDCWVSLTFNEILPKSVNFPQDIVIVDDYRFPNESEFVKNTSMYQVFEVRIESPDREMLKGTPEYDDISETSLPSGEDTRYHRTIYNLGSLEDLDEKCKVLALDVEQKSDMW